MVRRALPAAPTQLIGREADVLAAGRLIAGRARLVTLTGPGGVGKTRLAFAVAEAVAPRFTEGLVLVSLAPLRDPGLVLSAVVDCLGLRQSGPRSPRELLHEHLGGRSILLVLDNFEHVMTAGPISGRCSSGLPRRGPPRRSWRACDAQQG